jgi:hypothetical protein
MDSKPIAAATSMVLPDTLPLTDWQSFYVIVGSSGAALIGLQFIVITLIAQSSIKSSHTQLGAFGTPQLVHFGAALSVAAVMSAPWHTLQPAAIGIGLCGVVGLVFVGLVLRRSRKQQDYKLVWEDWLWHAIVPFVVYAALIIAAFMVQRSAITLFVVAAIALSLVFIGIRNAWDTVTFIVVERMPEAAARQAAQASPQQKPQARKGPPHRNKRTERR